MMKHEDTNPAKSVTLRVLKRRMGGAFGAGKRGSVRWIGLGSGGLSVYAGAATYKMQWS